MAKVCAAISNVFSLTASLEMDIKIKHAVVKEYGAWPCLICFTALSYIQIVPVKLNVKNYHMLSEI